MPIAPQTPVKNEDSIMMVDGTFLNNNGQILLDTSVKKAAFNSGSFNLMPASIKNQHEPALSQTTAGFFAPKLVDDMQRVMTITSDGAS